MKPPAYFLLPGLSAFLLFSLLSPFFSRAAQSPPDPADAARKAKIDLIRQIAEDAAFYQRLQFNPDTIVPNWVVAQAKGVLILERWPGPPAVDGNGQGIGMLKGSDKKYGAPAFYTLGNSTIGLQIGPASVHLVAFLMTDKALLSLTSNQFSWSGNLHAVAGSSSSTSAPAGATPDVILFQKAADLNAAANIASTTISVNTANNVFFYDKPGVTPTDIFRGKVDMPKATAPLVDAFNQQSGSPE